VEPIECEGELLAINHRYLEGRTILEASIVAFVELKYNSYFSWKHISTYRYFLLLELKLIIRSPSV